jgi:hypothetical protein
MVYEMLTIIPLNLIIFASSSESKFSFNTFNSPWYPTRAVLNILGAEIEILKTSRNGSGVELVAGVHADLGHQPGVGATHGHFRRAELAGLRCIEPRAFHGKDKPKMKCLALGRVGDLVARTPIDASSGLVPVPAKHSCLICSWRVPKPPFQDQIVEAGLRVLVNGW